MLKTVLIVDDDPILAVIAEGFFRNRGAETVEIATDGHNALASMAEREMPYDFVLCDLNMPNLDGLELIRYLKEQAYKGPVAFLSGEDEMVLDSARRLAISGGLNLAGVLPKPFDMQALDALIAAMPDEKAETLARPEFRKFSPEEVATGIAAGQFEAWFQPKVAAGGGTLKGAEVLARWNHPDEGIVAPFRFIPIAEEHDMIGALTEALIDDWLGAVASWKEAGTIIKIAVNMSGDLLNNPSFPDEIARRVDARGLDRGCVVFEVTEENLLSKLEHTLEVLARLRMKGFSVSIDDFGTGFSNIEQLRMFPFSELKIDRSFVQDARKDPFAPECVEASVRLGMRIASARVSRRAKTGITSLPRASTRSKVSSLPSPGRLSTSPAGLASGAAGKCRPTAFPLPDSARFQRRLGQNSVGVGNQLASPGRKKSPVSGLRTQSSPEEMSNHMPCRCSFPRPSRITTHGNERKFSMEWRIEIRSRAVCLSALVIQ